MFGVLQGWMNVDREKLTQNDTCARLNTCRYPVGSSCVGEGVGDVGERISPKSAVGEAAQFADHSCQISVYDGCDMNYYRYINTTAAFY